MSKTLTVASKFSEEELDKIDWYVKQNNTTRSKLFHDIIMQAINGDEKHSYDISTTIQEVTFRFINDYSYFLKGREYRGMINEDDASIYFGGEWMNYKLNDLPVEIIA